MIENNLKEQTKNVISALMVWVIANVFLSMWAQDNQWPPYEYWTFVRLGYTFSALFIAYNLSKLGDEAWKFGFVFIAILFNPIFIVELTPDIWSWIHIGYMFYLLQCVKIFDDN